MTTRKALNERWECVLDNGFCKLHLGEVNPFTEWRNAVIDTPPRRYHTAWNGERFARSTDMGVLEKRFPGAILKMAEQLRGTHETT